MKLSDLFEAQAKHREDISVEKAMELFQRHCSDMDINLPCWRGSKTASAPAYVIQGDKGKRASANSSNYYTVLMDEFLPKLGFPRRSGSIILTNQHGYEYARGYSRRDGEGNRGLYAIFPFNGVPIGVCQAADIWHLKFKIGKSRIARTTENWNAFFSGANVPDDTFDDIVEGIQRVIQDEKDTFHNLYVDIFSDDPDLVPAVLEDAYGDPDNLGVELATSKTLERFKDENELWIGGKCLAIREDIWKKLTGKTGDDDDDF